MKKHTLKQPLGILLGSLLILTGCGSSGNSSQEAKCVTIDTLVSTTGGRVIQYPGKVKAAEDIDLSFRVSGTIRSIHVKEGSYVRKGQLLAQLDDTDYRVQLAATEAEYSQVKAEAERVKALYQDGGTTPNVYDKAVYGLQQITAKYQHHKDQLSYTQLLAPFDGYVQKSLFKEHETVGAGMPVLSIISAGAPEVEINLPAAAYIHRDNFRSYECTFDLYPGEHYPLKLISITPKANANQLYTMRLQIETAGHPTPSAGMNTFVTIQATPEEGDRFYASTGALLQVDGQSYVYLYDKQQGKVHRVAVTVEQLLSDGRCILRGEQLQAGDCIIASGVHHLNEGDAVQPLAPVSKTNVGGLL